MQTAHRVCREHGRSYALLICKPFRRHLQSQCRRAERAHGRPFRRGLPSLSISCKELLCWLLRLSICLVQSLSRFDDERRSATIDDSAGRLVAMAEDSTRAPTHCCLCIWANYGEINCLARRARPMASSACSVMRVQLYCTTARVCSGPYFTLN